LSLADHAKNSVIPNVLSIAGSDPSGGAGIQADLKTFAALGCHGMAAIAALTAQNTLGVAAVHLPPPSFVAEQIASVLADADVAAIKVGMLGSRAIVEAVADALAARPGVPLVLDPVLVATSGAALGNDGVIAAMRARLFPLATLVTPNLFEAARLAGEDGTATREEMEYLARTLKGEGSAAWLIKGGHRDGDRAEDYLLGTDLSRWFSSPRVATRNTHGTGCTLSSAIAAFLAHGHDLATAVGLAKAYLGEALAGADALSAGRGAGPVDHFVRWRR
jgi:hydroxymethylpyrimidine kinase/phosphomethylpyrimidine kinase